MALLSMLLVFFGPIAGVCFAFSKPKLISRLGLLLSSVLPLLGMLGLLILVLQNGLKMRLSLGNMSSGVDFAFSTGRIGMCFALLIAVLYPIAILYSTSYVDVKKQNNEGRFFAFLNLAIFGGFGVAFADNLLVLFIFYELITASTYPLLVSNKNNASKSAGRYYLFHLIGSSTLLVLPVIAIIYHETASLTFFTSGILRGANFSSVAINVMFFSMLFGFAKTAIFPLHSWLLQAMVAPVPVSAILHAVIVVKSGIFAVIITSYKIFGADVLDAYLWQFCNVNLFTWAALITVFFAGIKALVRDNLKERLAYSTISQSSYILLMVSLFNEASLKATIVQFVVHSLAKVTLFFAAGGLYIINNSFDISKITKVWDKSAIVAVSVLLGCLAILGFPPTIGFYAKYNMFIATFSENNVFVGVLVVAGTILSACYLISLLYHVFFVPVNMPKSNSTSTKLPFGISISLLILCVLLLCGYSVLDYLLFLLVE